jgi:hypothetical protein
MNGKLIVLQRTAQRHKGSMVQRFNGTTVQRRNGTTEQKRNSFKRFMFIPNSNELLATVPLSRSLALSPSLLPSGYQINGTNRNFTLSAYPL